MEIAALFALKAPTLVTTSGWIRTIRKSKSVNFIILNDGTTFNSIQISFSNELQNADEILHLFVGSAIIVTGQFILTPDAQQPFEIQAHEITVVGAADADFPLQKKGHSLEFLREIAHLRVRTNTFNALYRLRSCLSLCIHQYFHDRHYVYLHAPILTCNDAEGAGEIFRVTTRSDNCDEQDIFRHKTLLTVTGQLHAEAFAHGFRSVYTFGPAFRAERSNTPRHANEFWMIEPETAFTDLAANLANIEAVIKHCIKTVLETCSDELDFFERQYEPGLKARLNATLNAPFKRLTYTEAIDLLIADQKTGVKFVYDNIAWGMDLQSEHEKYLCEVVINGPVFLTDYPREIKAFYMKLNPDQKTVAAVDLLVPKIGELVGGSERETNYDLLVERMKALGMDTKSLSWYLDLRRFGSTPHSGYGIGFDRLIMFLTGMSNIRDTEPFGRTPGSIKY